MSSIAAFYGRVRARLWDAAFDAPLLASSGGPWNPFRDIPHATPIDLELRADIEKEIKLLNSAVYNGLST